VRWSWVHLNRVDVKRRAGTPAPPGTKKTGTKKTGTKKTGTKKTGTKKAGTK
jgi:hypothetical protein